MELTGKTAVIRLLLQVLDALDPAGAALVRNSLPQLNSTFGLGLAFFLAVTAKGGRAWLGRDIAAKLDGLDGGALLDAVEKGLQPDHRQTADGRRWRVSSIPVIAGGSALSLLCAIGLGEGGSDGVAAECPMVLQIQLPSLGTVQLTLSSSGKQVELTLQTADGLPASLLAELQESFSMALADTGLKGNLVFGSTVGAWLDLGDRLSADAVL
jgi:hypothetical protein